MRERLFLNFKGKEIVLDLKVCNFVEKFTGLMFCRRENAESLLFKFRNPARIKIHSWFVFFPFVAIWLDEKNKIVDLKLVKNFNFGIAPKKKFSKLIEIPISRRYNGIIKTLSARDLTRN